VRNRIVQFMILAILLAGVGYVLFINLSHSVETVKVNKQAPDFTVKLLNGEPFTLSEHRGKGVLINFWATTCKPCLNEMPAIQSKYDKYKDQGLEVIGVNTGENEVSVSTYVNRLGVNFPIGLDREFEVTELYKTGQLPRSIFVDPDGVVRGIHLGEMSPDMIEEYISKILP
jgi:peroxiredoxin